MSSAMPVVDLALALWGAAEQARDRSSEPADAYDQLARACTELRAVITGENWTGGDASREVERARVDDDTAQRMRAELTTLSHDRSEERARAITQQLRELQDRLA